MSDALLGFLVMFAVGWSVGAAVQSLRHRFTDYELARRARATAFARANGVQRGAP